MSRSDSSSSDPLSRSDSSQPEYPDVAFCKVDVDENQQVAAQCGIKSMPTFQFWKNGKCINSFSGADESKLRWMISDLRYAGFDEIREGVTVKIRGLVSAAQHNGKNAQIVSRVADSGRYVVRFLDDGSSISVKPQCFTQVRAVADGPVPLWHASPAQHCNPSATACSLLPDGRCGADARGGESSA